MTDFDYAVQAAAIHKDKTEARGLTNAQLLALMTWTRDVYAHCFHEYAVVRDACGPKPPKTNVVPFRRAS